MAFMQKPLSKLSAGSDWLRMGSGHVVSDDHVINSLFAWACGIVGVRGQSSGTLLTEGRGR